MDITVMLSTCNRSDILAHTLASFCLLNVSGIKWELLVVDNADDEKTRQTVKKYSSSLPVKYLLEAKRGKNNALNRAVSDAQGTLYVFTDDIRISEDCLLKYENGFKRYGERCFLGGSVGVDYEVEPEAWLKEYLPDSAVGFELGNEEKVVNKPIFLGCNWGTYSEVLKKIGSFNTKMGPGPSTLSTGQEQNAMRKLLNNNIKGVYLPQARAWHYVPMERCSKKWILNRAFKNGVQEGIYRKRSHEKSLLKYPKWMLKKKLLLYLEYYLRIYSKQKRFKKKYQIAYLNGLIRGLIINNQTDCL